MGERGLGYLVPLTVLDGTRRVGWAHVGARDERAARFVALSVGLAAHRGRWVRVGDHAYAAEAGLAREGAGVLAAGSDTRSAAELAVAKRDAVTAGTVEVREVDGGGSVGGRRYSDRWYRLPVVAPEPLWMRTLRRGVDAEDEALERGAQERAEARVEAGR